MSILAGALFALGIIALFKSSVSLIVLGIGSMIIGIAVNYPLHYVDHLKYQPDKRKALADQVNPLLVGNITTVGAFLSLLLLKAEALHDFGFIGAMMLVGTILFVLVFLPVLVPAASRPRWTSTGTSTWPRRPAGGFSSASWPSRPSCSGSAGASPSTRTCTTSTT